MLVFHNLTLGQFVVEQLLFWLSASIYEKCPQSEAPLFALFIYKTFIEDDAPLLINLPHDVRLDIPVPSGSPQQGLFDESIDEVYSTLKAVVFIEFEKSPVYKDMLEFKSKQRIEFMSALIGDTDFYSAFSPSKDAVMEILNSIVAFQSSGCTAMFDYSYRQKILQETLKLYYPANKIVNVGQYFTELSALSSVQRKRKIVKEKKLNKFFGDRPNERLLSNQLSSKTRNDADRLCDMTFQDDAIIEDDDDDDEGQITSIMRKKKVEKITRFFGDRPIFADDEGFDALPNIQEDLVQFVPPTSNDLESKEKLILQKKQRKINKLFGGSFHLT